MTNPFEGAPDLSSYPPLDPPHELSTILHARITEQLHRLRGYDANDQDVRQVSDLTDDELRQAAGIIRAIRALPSWTDKSYAGGNVMPTSHTRKIGVSPGFTDAVTPVIKPRAGRSS